MPESPAAESSPQLLHQVGESLDEERVPWAAIGALAVAYHGWVRASLDSDALITLRGTGSDLQGLAAKLRGRGWTVEARTGEPGDPLAFVIRITDDRQNQVDLIGIAGLDPGFFQRSIEADLDGLALKVASAEDLVALKIYAGGPMDLEDAAKVMEVAGPSLDRNLLLGLCADFGEEAEKRARTLLKA